MQNEEKINGQKMSNYKQMQVQGIIDAAGEPENEIYYIRLKLEIGHQSTNFLNITSEHAEKIKEIFGGVE